MRRPAEVAHVPEGGVEAEEVVDRTVDAGVNEESGPPAPAIVPPTPDL